MKSMKGLHPVELHCVQKFIPLLNNVFFFYDNDDAFVISLRFLIILFVCIHIYASTQQIPQTRKSNVHIEEQ